MVPRIMGLSLSARWRFTAVVWAVACGLAVFCACRPFTGKPSVATRFNEGPTNVTAAADVTKTADRHVVVGATRWDLFAENQEIFDLLKSNGIPMSLDGSLLFDILVPAKDAQRAIAILTTNHLFLEGIIRVGYPPKKDIR